MKRTSLFILVLLVAGLFGCEENKPTEAKDFNNNLKDFNESIHHVDKTMDLMDKMDSEMAKVTELKKSGKISDEEAEHRLDIIRTKYTKKISRTANVKSTTSFPEWAKQLGLSEPQGMKIDLNRSQITSSSDKNSGYNSINFVYNGSYDVAMKQAKKIAYNAGVPIGSDYQQALDLAKELNTDPIKGAVYMNFEIGIEDMEQYHIAITVDEVGTLTITATDVKQLAKQIEGGQN